MLDELIRGGLIDEYTDADGRAVWQYEKGEHPPSGRVTLIYELLGTAISSRSEQTLNEWAVAIVEDAKAG